MDWECVCGGVFLLKLLNFSSTFNFALTFRKERIVTHPEIGGSEEEIKKFLKEPRTAWGAPLCKENPRPPIWGPPSRDTPPQLNVLLQKVGQLLTLLPLKSVHNPLAHGWRLLPSSHPAALRANFESAHPSGWGIKPAIICLYKPDS